MLFILWCPFCAVLPLFQRGAPLYPKSVSYRLENKQVTRVVLHKWTIHQTIMTIIYAFCLNFIFTFIALKALFNSALCLLFKQKIVKSQTEGSHLGPFRSTKGLMECRNFTLGSFACSCLFHLVNLATCLDSKFEALFGWNICKTSGQLNAWYLQGKNIIYDCEHFNVWASWPKGSLHNH